MTESLEYSALLRLIDEGAAAFTSAVAAAPGVDVPVPSCPEWTLFDLVEHLGRGSAGGPRSSPRARPRLRRPRMPQRCRASSMRCWPGTPSRTSCC
ncbi:maleylpyruvate isomerase N-terminal domain-containing protein [Streptomyces sp. NPDC003660]